MYAAGKRTGCSGLYGCFGRLNHKDSKIQNTFLGILIGGIFITFPSTACNFSYSFSVDAYSLSFLMAIFSVYLIEKNQKKINFLAAATILGFSIGIYQSSITFSIALIFILLLSEALNNEIIFKEFLIRISRFVFFLFLGLAIYFIFSKSVMFVMGISASAYRSMDSITQFSLTDLLKGLFYSYAYFAAYYFTTYYLYSVYRVILNVLALIMAVILLIPLYKKMLNKQPAPYFNIAFSGILIFLTPVGLNSLPLLMGDRVETGVHRIMLFSLVFLYFLYIKLIDTNLSLPEEYQGIGKKAATQWIGLLPLIAAIYSGFLICNQAYGRMNTRYENIYAFLNRIAARMEETPEWSHDIPVYFANPSHIFNANYEVEIKAYDDLRRMMGTDLYPWYNSEELVSFFEIYLHFPVREASSEQIADISASEEFNKMPVFPAEGSIKVIDDVMIVKPDERSH